MQRSEGKPDELTWHAEAGVRLIAWLTATGYLAGLAYYAVRGAPVKKPAVKIEYPNGDVEEVPLEPAPEEEAEEPAAEPEPPYIPPEQDKREAENVEKAKEEKKKGPKVRFVKKLPPKDDTPYVPEDKEKADDEVLYVPPEQDEREAENVEKAQEPAAEPEPPYIPPEQDEREAENVEKAAGESEEGLKVRFVEELPEKDDSPYVPPSPREDEEEIRRLLEGGAAEKPGDVE